MCGGLLTLVLAPLAIARGLVVDAGQEVEVVEGHLLLLDTELMIQLAPRRILDATDGVGQVGSRFGRHVQRVGAARVGPHVGEGNLFRRALLQKQLVLVVEEEDGEGSVEEALVDVGHKVACAAGISQYKRSLWPWACPPRKGREGWQRTELLAGGPDGQVILVGDDANLIHQADLLLIVALEGFPPRVDVREEAEDVLGRDGRRARRGGRHDVGVAGGYTGKITTTKDGRSRFVSCDKDKQDVQLPRL